MRKVIVLFLLLALVGGLYYALTRQPVTAPAGGYAALRAGQVHPAATDTATDTATATATDAPPACVIVSGYPAGTVNLRACGSLACAVVDILNEKQRVAVLAAGDWLNVQTGEGVTGYVNSIFCK